MNRLLAFLKDNCLTHQEFAAMCGVERSTVTKWIKGTRNPSPKAMKIIGRKTRGSVAVEKDDPSLPYSKRLELALYRNGLTVLESSKKLRMSRNAISRYVKGETVPSDKARARLYKLLGVQ